MTDCIDDDECTTNAVDIGMLQLNELALNAYRFPPTTFRKE